VVSVIGLARATYEGPRQLEELKRLVSGAHQLRLLLTRVDDASWLGRSAREMVPLPRSDEPWPVVGLIDGLGRSIPASWRTSS
jgi:hypothetical protein